MKVRGNYSTFAVVNMNDLSKVDFSQVGQTSADTVRKNLLDPPTQFIIKWDVEPTFITDGTVIPDGIYTYEECLELMTSPTWTEPVPPVL